MLRKFAVGLAALGALNAAQVQALGLGEVTVHSALNQPLEAEIDLLQIRDLAASQIITGLADSDEFYLAGVKPTAVLSDIRFELDIRESGGKIFLTTREPIREPFLNFLVEVNWPSGRLVREYTVLLDPPVFTAKDLAPRSMPVPPATQAQPQAPMTPPASVPTSPRQVPGPTAGRSYRVGNDDTLWAIALETRPDRSVSPQQMMLALQKANPEAFINNNINRLKSGVVLRIPGADEVASLGGQDPVGEVKRQNVAWRGDAGQAPSTQGSQLDATSDQEASEVSSPEGDSRLRIVSQPAQAETETEQAPGTLVADETQGEGVVADPLAEELLNKNLELEEQLVVTLEGLDKVERDNVELFQRLDQLGNQMASMQRLLELKDQQLAELQVSLNENQNQAAPPPPPVQESGGMMETLTSPAALIGGLAALVALVGGLLFARKRKQDEERAVNAAMAELDEREDASGSDLKLAAGAATAAGALGAVHAESEKDDEAAVEVDPSDPFNLDSDGSGDEFDSLTPEDLEASLGDDLDMDLKIDEPIDEDPEMAEFADSLLSDDDYDLGTDELTDDETDSQEMLGQEQETEAGEVDDIDDVDDLDFVLGDRTPVQSEPEPEPATAEEDSDDLDFILNTGEETKSSSEQESPLEDQASDEDSELLGDLDDLLAMDSETVGAEEVADEATQETSEPDTSPASATDEEPELLGELDDLLSESSDAVASTEEASATPSDQDDEFDSLNELSDQADTESILESALDSDEEATDFAAEQLEEPLTEQPVEEDRDDIDRLLAEAGADVGAEEAMKPQASSASEEGEAEEDLDAFFANFDDDQAKPETTVKESSTDDLEGLDLELEDEAGGLESAEQTTEDAASDGDDPVEDELDQAADQDLEAELSQMLEKEDNGLSLEETALDEGDPETDYLAGADEAGTKLDLARAYIDMDDSDGAKDILNEVLKEGSESQVEEAKQLLANL